MDQAITMIPIEQLKHHPENPRLDLGDLTELMASIKANGIYQNLTVVRDETYDPDPGQPRERYLVVIGNRRLEASRAVGLKELPCKISDMPRAEQISTMIQENMQRSDLTLYEQAKGIQMMMSLGYTKEQVSEKTGLSKTTIERRVAVASLPDALAKKAIGVGYDLLDLVEISKIQDAEEREKLLTTATTVMEDGTLNRPLLRQQIRIVQRREEIARERERLVPQIEKFAVEMNRQQEGRRFWSPWVHRSEYDVELKPGATVKVPTDGGKYYYAVLYNMVEIYQQEAQPEHVLTPEEIALKEHHQKAVELANRMRDNRIAFVSSYTPTKTQEAKLRENLWRYVFGWPCGASPGHFYKSFFQWDVDTFRELAGMPKEENREGEENLPEGEENLLDELKRRHIPMGRAILAWTLSGGLEEDQSGSSHLSYADTYRFTRIENKALDRIYEILTDAGYVLSEEERQWKDGTHEIYKRRNSI